MVLLLNFSPYYFVTLFSPIFVEIHGKKSNITPIHKKTANKFLKFPIIFVFCDYMEKFLKNLILKVFVNV